MSSVAFGDGTKIVPTCHCLVDKTTTMCESYLTKTYLKIFGASSCRCTGIAECLRSGRGSFTRFLGKSLVLVKWGGGISELCTLPKMVFKCVDLNEMK